MKVHQYLYLILIHLFITSCFTDKNCPQVKHKSIKEINSIFDSISKVRDDEKKQREEYQKKGILIDFLTTNSVYFNQFCASSQKLQGLYYVIGYMLKNEKTKVKITGHIDSIEFIKAKETSQKRLNFIKNIMIESGIESYRIFTEDILNKQPEGQDDDENRFYNRRVDFEVII